MNIAIIVACTSAFPAFFAKSKGLGSTVYQSLWTRLNASRFSASRSDGTASAQGGSVMVGKSMRLEAEAEGWQGQGKWVQLREVRGQNQH